MGIDRMNKIFLRSVNEKDLKRIFEWRNHPEVRKNMFNGCEIKWEEHLEFWNERSRDKESYSFIVMKDEEAIGVARLDKRQNIYEVDILIDPLLQGQGHGTAAVSRLTEFASKKQMRLCAKIKPDNIASQMLFESNNFKKRYLYLEWEEDEKK